MVKVKKKISKEKKKVGKGAEPRGKPNVILFGTGEYTTGYVHSDGSKSDKGVGVVGLVRFDLRARQLIGDKIV